MRRIPSSAPEPFTTSLPSVRFAPGAAGDAPRMNPRALITTSVLVLLLAAAAGCGSSGGGNGSGSKTIVAAGSSLVAPLVAKWSDDYLKSAGVTVTYGSIGSGGGIAQITARTVDVGASDAPLTPDQASACKGCVQVPWALAATLVAYHVNGAPQKLRLSGPVLANIFLGKIKQWNDPAIAELNPGAKLPATNITPVYRSDGSGDTYAFTDYLSKVSPEWKSKLGFSTQVAFPAGTGGKGNDGVAAVVSSRDGTIGYLGISYVFSNHLEYALVENAAGKFPTPSVQSILEAAKTVSKLGPDNTVSITDPPASAPGAYPISTFTYAIVPKDTAKASVIKPFLNYAVTDGQKFATSLQFAELPPNVVTADQQAIEAIG
jgi:phosphate transport system substrate-binding protein